MTPERIVQIKWALKLVFCPVILALMLWPVYQWFFKNPEWTQAEMFRRYWVLMAVAIGTAWAWAVSLFYLDKWKERLDVDRDTPTDG